MSKLEQLAQLGQSIWLDFIRRTFITSGRLQEWVDQGVRGVTSNPSIFEKAIAGSADYDEYLRKLADKGKSVEQIYEELALEDIRLAADILRPVFNATQGTDGYVSLEVRPDLANDSAGTLQDAVRLFSTLDRPNIMIKIPATQAGILAIEAAVAKGININATLIFSLGHYEAVAEAYICGLESLAASGGDISKVASVASFFISRVDSAVDLSLMDINEGHKLRGKIAIANAKVSYARFKEIFNGERWEKLAALGAQVQRPLWASTSTKNPFYPDTMYVDSLIAPDTINTVPPATLEAFIDHGEVVPSLDKNIEKARSQLSQLTDLGVDLNELTNQLQAAGIVAFTKSFETLRASITEKLNLLESGQELLSTNLSSDQSIVDAASQELESEHIISRIWEHDYSVWKPEPLEITNRLGWLHIIDPMLAQVPHLQALTQSVLGDKYTHALLLGMGGSSLAPDVLRHTFGAKKDFLDLAVLDSTVPGAVLSFAEQLDLSKTLFIVSTKSGGTVETLTFFKYFYNRVLDEVGEEKAGEHFIAITDPGSKLVDIANQYKFRNIFLNDPNIGGRYSALTYFGMVPAALMGIDVKSLLERAGVAACNCAACNCRPAGDNRSELLGAIIGALAKTGIDKLTLVTSPSISHFGDWVEQLIAESIGKEGKGILPVVGEPIAHPDGYDNDRLFVYLRLEKDHTYDNDIKALEDAGFPIVRLLLKDNYDLGAQFFLWEMATAVAGHLLNINPFNQPNVESAKFLARKMVADYQEHGSLPEEEAVIQSEGILVYGDTNASTPQEALAEFIQFGQPGAYIALQAYLQPTPKIDKALLTLRSSLRDKTHFATTVGYGPRFLHSTGQLHKGDAGHGLFIQFTADDPRDVAIPDQAGVETSSISFGVLKRAQVLGDALALKETGRKVIRFHFERDIIPGLSQLLD